MQARIIKAEGSQLLTCRAFNGQNTKLRTYIKEVRESNFTPGRHTNLSGPQCSNFQLNIPRWKISEDISSRTVRGGPLTNT